MKDKKISASAVADLDLIGTIKRNKGQREADRAFAALYNKYHDPMYIKFKGMASNEDDARDVVQEAFIKLSENIYKFNEDTACFSTWMFKLTYNLFIDKLRKNQKMMFSASLSEFATCNEDGYALEYEINSKEPSAITKMIINERNKKMAEIISKMHNKNLATVVKMRFYDGLTYEEISQETAKPINTIKVLVLRAKQILKEEFKKANLVF